MHSQNNSVEKNGNILNVELKGDILDNSFDIQDLVKDYTPGSLVRFNCSRISRINSVGVRAWISNFKNLQTKGIAYVLAECSVAIVDQMNQMHSFVPGGKVESVHAPFSCNDCGNKFTLLFDGDKLKEMALLNQTLPKMECPHCGAENTEFDDLPDYFAFLRHVSIADKS